MNEATYGSTRGLSQRRAHNRRWPTAGLGDRTLDASRVPVNSRADGPRYIRIDELAAYTSLTVRHLHDLTRRGEIPHIRVGKVVVYDRHAIDEWLGSQAVPASAWRQQKGLRAGRRQAQ